MKNVRRLLSLLCLGFCLSALAQAQGGVTLVVVSDSNCNWKLDGQPMGRINRFFARAVSVSPGEHLIEAAATDGVGKIELKVVANQDQRPVDLRLKSEDYQQAKMQRGETARKPAKVDAALSSTAPDQTWTDPATGLMWAAQDNGLDVNWHQANAYCADSKLADHSDWRLPTIDELHGMYDPGVTSEATWDSGAVDVNVKGNLRLTGWSWSSSLYLLPSRTEEYYGGLARASAFTHAEDKGGFWFSSSYNTRALCVRDSGQMMSMK